MRNRCKNCFNLLKKTNKCFNCYRRKHKNQQGFFKQMKLKRLLPPIIQE